MYKRQRWVKNIREFLKENQYVVCRVMKVEGDHIHLSVKRVRPEEASSKLNEFKRERKAEKLLELAAKTLNKSLEEAHEEVGYKLKEEIGSLSKAFEFALKNPELLETKGIPKKWVDVLKEIAKKNYAEKTFEVKSELTLICYDPNGIDIIKKVLSSVAEENGLEAKYISAPKYIITGRGKDYKKVESRVRQASERIVSEINKFRGSCGFKLVED